MGTKKGGLIVFHPDLRSVCGGEEFRRLPRTRSAVVCSISHGACVDQVHGVVRDIHDEGARVRPDCDTRAINGLVELDVGGRKFLAKLAWKNEREIGLHFVADLTDEQDKLVRTLREGLAAMKRA